MLVLVLEHINFYIFFILFVISLAKIFYAKGLLYKLFGLSIFQSNIIFLFLSVGWNQKKTIPIVSHSSIIDNITNPLPSVLMLTAIVVGLATFALGLSIYIKMNQEK